MSFLTAEWRKLVLANYVVEPDLLRPWLPYGTELDLWRGRCYLSLVGFMFMNTRLLGVKIPFHTHFEEVNLRFYVRRKAEGEWRRGVVFVREFVPKPALSFVANTVYREHYRTVPMRHRWRTDAEATEVEYEWKKGGQWHRLFVQAQPSPTDFDPAGETAFITEHYWGYARVNDRKTNEYQVTHPSWQVYPITTYEMEVDFGTCYGPAFSFLNEENPVSVMRAEGSAITVEPHRSVKA